MDRAVSSMDKFLLTLRFLAAADSYITIGDCRGIHKTTVRWIIYKCVKAICHLERINLPKTEEDIQEIKRDLFNIFHFPRVIRSIDCSHVKKLFW